MLFLLLLLSIFTYYVVKRSVAGITRTPTWLLWLVMMIPAFVLAFWSASDRADEPFPIGILLGLFILCPVLYWMLIQWGRIPQKANGQDSTRKSAAAEVLKAAAEKAAIPPIDKEEEATIQHCFPWSVYYLQNIEYRPQALICKGQLRASPTVAYETVRENIEANFGKRFLVIFQEGLNGKPFFALVPNPERKKADKPPRPDKLTRPGLAIGLFVATLFTTTAVGAFINGVTEEALQGDPNLFFRGLPYAISLLIILGIHELGHYLTARRYKMKATLPYFIPIPFFLGTFGAFIQLRSPVPNRRALFDIGIAGPMSGLVVALPLLIWGLANSDVVTMPENASLLNFEALDPGASIALALLSKLALGSQLTIDSAIHLHPVAVSGCLGLVVTALNLMPVGQLDGGHIVHAMYGQRNGAIIGQVCRFLVLGLTFVHGELLIWAILLFFIPAIDEPALNDVSELDDKRDLWGLVALTILVLIVLPTPGPLKALLF
ncbi:site-2 protease family protein [Oscillatoria sp. CS-180]|uniref:site-2 protease family protein n=1 Tax=Oscillatoria sp. CS-180 TaxID=3021720 RepID=UPI00232F6CFB|nr:site-2 protease family protein [Oscillatoria sp. CS-180]MDB9526818.1 site-2 protease family protein [Oscillatoria sp. CS-180]